MRIGRENTKFQCKANHKSFVFPTDQNLPMASSRTHLNPACRALFVATMKKGKKAGKKKKKTTAPVDDSSEDEAVERVVRSIARDTSPQEEQEEPSASCCSSPSSAESPPTINSPPPSRPVEAPSSPERVRTAETTEEEIRRLKEHIRKLEDNFETLLQQNDSRNIPVEDTAGGSPGETQNKRFQEAIKSVIEDCINKDKRFVRWFPERRGKQLAQAFFSVLDGTTK
jgi:hypothetical protein